MQTIPYLSVVVPLFNEEGNVAKLLGELQTVLQHYPRHQIIFVNDGSTDGSQKVLEKLYQENPQHVAVIEFRTNQGKATALQAGFESAQGDFIITMDADLQDDPADIPKMLAKIAEGYDVVSGWKENRVDSPLKNHTSKLFNAATRKISGLQLKDFNCGFKIYRRESLENLTLYGELHRYIPALLHAQGFKVGEQAINHRKRYAGSTKYGAIRFLNGLLDLITISFLTKFQSRPLHFFGYIGLSMFSIGFAVASYLAVFKFVADEPIGNRPLLLFAVTLMIVGGQVLVTGIIGEHINFFMNRSSRQNTPPVKSKYPA